MAHRRSYYLYKRHKKNGDYWYVCFLDKETGKQMSAKSVDCLKERLGLLDFRSITRKEDAAVIAQKAIDAGFVYSDDASKLFVDYCRNFWDYDHSDYIRMRNNLKKGAIGKEYAYNMLKNFEKHVAPLLPLGLKLQSVTPRVLDTLMKTLYAKGLSSGSIQIIEYTFSSPLKEAVRLGLINENPADRILRIAKTESTRGVLTSEEVYKLRKTLSEMKDDLFRSYYLGILLGMATGMRCSEIRALSKEDIVESAIPGFHKVLVRHSVAYLTGLKGTKSKYDRSVLIPSSLAEELLANANNDGVILPSPQKSKPYMSAPSLRAAFYEVLDHMGISEAEREDRNITFHSLRHSFSTLSRDANISQEDRMVVLGHKSKEVNDRYTHASDEALLHVSALTQKIYGTENFQDYAGAI